MMKRRQCKVEAYGAIEALAARWPKCFVVYERHRVPMRVGIHKDILAAGFPKAGLRLALRIYTGNGNYLFALRPGAPRVDLDGNVAGVVSEEAALVAAAELSRRKARNQARREAQHQEQERAAIKAKAAAPKKLSLVDLRAAAQARKKAAA
jgi:ProP effector